MLKIQKYNILQELFSDNPSESKLVIQISDNIEAIHDRVSLVNNQDWMDLIPHVRVEQQLMVAAGHQMLGNLFGHSILKSTFLQFFPPEHQVELLNGSLLVHLSKGEHIYKYDQNSHHSSQSSPVYIILDGRVNLLLGRNICFKTYIVGSYFGDIEYFTKRRRLFSARVEEQTTLMVISCDTLEKIFLANPQSHLDLYRRAIKRYLHYKQSMKKASYYEMITISNQWWVNGHQSHFNDRQIYTRLDRFFSVIAENNQHLHIHSNPQNPDCNVIERFGTRNLVFSPVSKKKKTQQTLFTRDTKQFGDQQGLMLDLHKASSIGSDDSQHSESEEAKPDDRSVQQHAGSHQQRII